MTAESIPRAMAALPCFGPWALFALGLLIAPGLHAQVYREDFTSGGAGWTLNVPTGTNGASANAWVINPGEGGVLPPACGVRTNGNPTLHITCTSLFCGSLIIGAVYNHGSTSNQRAESPDIDATGQSGLILSFNAVSLGDGVLDNASVQYRCGSGWTELLPSIKTSLCGDGVGQWTAFSAALPPACDNHSSLRIGFRWTNNGDNIGTDPSVAIDNIVISVAGTNVFADGFEDVAP